MDNQQLFNVLFALVGVLGGWWMKAIWQAVKQLEKTDHELINEINQLRVLVAGDYMKRSEFKDLSDALFSTLRRIEDKLDSKADK